MNEPTTQDLQRELRFYADELEYRRHAAFEAVTEEDFDSEDYTVEVNLSEARVLIGLLRAAADDLEP
jgi:hypothetical protein